jgi:hypothetical protein
MRIRGVDGMDFEAIRHAVAGGRRFVFYEWCISLVIVSTRRPSDIHFLRADELGLWRAIPYTMVTLLFGWWGLPWGLIYTPLVLVTNLGGGQDVTDEVLMLLRRRSGPTA